MRNFLIRWAVTTVAVFLSAHVVGGIHYRSFGALIAASLILGILNAILRPILMLLALPLLVVSFGLFILVINGLLYYFVGAVVTGFEVDGFWAAFWGALIVSLVSMFANALLGTNETRVEVRRTRNRRHGGGPGEGKGPVIDV